MNQPIILQTGTESGCTVRLFDCEERLLLMLDMEQPGDRRHAEVLLDRSVVEDIWLAISKWSGGEL